MINKDDRVFLNKEEALSCLNDGEQVHPFVNPAGGMLVGADWDRQKIEQLFDEYPDDIEIGGEQSRQMKHAIVVSRNGNPIFIEANEERINVFDPLPLIDNK